MSGNYYIVALLLYSKSQAIRRLRPRATARTGMVASPQRETARHESSLCGHCPKGLWVIEWSSLVAGFLIATKILLNNAAGRDRSLMKSKASRIVLDLVLSIIVFFVSLVVEGWIAGKIFGFTKSANGIEEIKGGMALTVAVFTISIILTIFFAVQFYKFMSRHKLAKVIEAKNVGE